MEPQVIGTSTAAGDDGNRYAVEVVGGYRRIDAGMRDRGGWAEDSLVALTAAGGWDEVIKPATPALKSAADAAP